MAGGQDGNVEHPAYVNLPAQPAVKVDVVDVVIRHAVVILPHVRVQGGPAGSLATRGCQKVVGVFDKLVHVGYAHGFTLETGRLKGLRYALHGGEAAVGEPLRDFDKQPRILAADNRRHVKAGIDGGFDNRFVSDSSYARRSASNSIKLP